MITLIYNYILDVCIYIYTYTPNFLKSTAYKSLHRSSKICYLPSLFLVNFSCTIDSFPRRKRETKLLQCCDCTAKCAWAFTAQVWHIKKSSLKVLPKITISRAQWQWVHFVPFPILIKLFINQSHFLFFLWYFARKSYHNSN